MHLISNKGGETDKRAVDKNQLSETKASSLFFYRFSISAPRRPTFSDGVVASDVGGCVAWPTDNTSTDRDNGPSSLLFLLGC